MIKEFSLYFLAAFFEILGCYSFWVYFKLDKSYWFLALGVVSLISFAYLLTKVNLEFDVIGKYVSRLNELRK